MARFLESKFGKRDLTAKNHWRSLDFADHKITRPTVIELSGNGTTDTIDKKTGNIIEGIKKINGKCALTERLVGLQHESAENDEFSSYNSIDIIGFSYGKDKKEDTVGCLADEDVKMIVEKMLIPLCIDFEHDEIYSYEQRCVNFSYITFSTHCWGAREVSRIMRKLFNDLKRWGFDEEEIIEMFSYCNHITYAPFSDDALIPNFRVDSIKDSVNIHYNYKDIYRKCYKQDLKGLEIRYDEAGYFRGQKNQFAVQPIATLWAEQLVNSELNNDKTQMFDEHSIEAINRDSQWKSSIKMEGKIIEDATNANLVSQVTGYVLALCLADGLNNRFSTDLPKRKLMDRVKEAELILKPYSSSGAIGFVKQ